jgi:hypothetical protein
MELVKQYRTGHSAIKAHLFKILFRGLSLNVDLRDRLAKASTIQEFDDVVTELGTRRKDIDPRDKFGWYFRYRKDEMPEYGMMQDRTRKRFRKTWKISNLLKKKHNSKTKSNSQS